jgi:hypothetical protein
MSRLRRSTKRASADPTEDHPFLEIDDSGMGAAASGSAFHSSNTANVLGVTTAFLRSTRCALPGCGKERHSPIHTVADE